MQFSDRTELCGGGAQCNCSPGVGVTICADERTHVRLKSKVWIPFYQSISLLFVPSRTYSTHLESEISGQNSDPSSSAERSVSGWYTYSAVQCFKCIVQHRDSLARQSRVDVSPRIVDAPCPRCHHAEEGETDAVGGGNHSSAGPLGSIPGRAGRYLSG